MSIRVIKTEEQYHSYLGEIESLITQMPAPGTDESDRLDLLTVLVESYEKTKYPIEPIDPIDAIKFKMEEKGLKQVDVTPYFGTKSRVSEVLSRKRPLTVPMIRALSAGLGISAETLIGVDSDSTPQNSEGINWSKFPVKEMLSRGWISKPATKVKSSVEDQVRKFLEQLDDTGKSAAFKRTINGESYSPATKYSLYAWLARVVQKSRDNRESLGLFSRDALSSSFLKELSKLSWSDYGPLLAVELLNKNGISVVIEPALKGALVDGAALKDKDGTPIIALTLRHDRLDNFWFTLLHEVAHIWKHIATDETFIDDLDKSSEDKVEAEANRISRDTFIPRSIWKRSEAYLSPSEESIDSLSKELKIHPAIIAGRIRRESGNYKKFTNLVGFGEVRKHFPQFISEENT